MSHIELIPHTESDVPDTDIDKSLARPGRKQTTATKL